MAAVHGAARRAGLHALIRANNRFWRAIYYDELIDTPDYQLTYLAGADAGYYSCAQAVARAGGDVLDEIEAYYRGKGVDPAIYLDPESPPALGERLAAAGWAEVPEEQEHCHVIDLAAPPRRVEPRAALRIAPERVTLVHLDTPDHPLLDALIEVDATANALPAAVREKLAQNLRTRRREGVEVHGFLALVDGAPASTRVVGFVGEIALLAEAATAPGLRRSGLYSWVTLEVLRFARDAGKRLAFQTAGRDAHTSAAVLGLGFTRACSRSYWRAPPRPGP